mmetsp:Transcript_14578/g.38683  ORF Transcript_14578/g.38683 Transcript_14578/m.38683 type:complete len:208 (+) Transcript_14578:340-963(+)
MAISSSRSVPRTCSAPSYPPLTTTSPFNAPTSAGTLPACARSTAAISSGGPLLSTRNVRTEPSAPPLAMTSPFLPTGASASTSPVKRRTSSLALFAPRPRHALTKLHPHDTSLLASFSIVANARTHPVCGPSFPNVAFASSDGTSRATTYLLASPQRRTCASSACKLNATSGATLISCLTSFVAGSSSAMVPERFAYARKLSPGTGT